MARDGVGLVFGCGLGSEGVGNVWCCCCGVLCRCRLADLRSFVRRLSCLLSALESGVLILLGSVWVYGWAIGQMVWASSWYAFNILTNRFAALSMRAGVALFDVVFFSIYWEALWWAACIVALPSL